MSILDNKHTIIIVKGALTEDFVVNKDSIIGAFIGDVLTLGVGNYDFKNDNLTTDIAILGKHDILARQHLVVGKHIHDKFEESRKKKENEK